MTEKLQDSLSSIAANFQTCNYFLASLGPELEKACNHHDLLIHLLKGIWPYCIRWPLTGKSTLYTSALSTVRKFCDSESISPPTTKLVVSCKRAGLSRGAAHLDLQKCMPEKTECSSNSFSYNSALPSFQRIFNWEGTYTFSFNVFPTGSSLFHTTACHLHQVQQTIWKHQMIWLRPTSEKPYVKQRITITNTSNLNSLCPNHGNTYRHPSLMAFSM